MAKLYNLARMTTATTGTGTITLGAAVLGYLTFAQAGVSNGDVVDYAIKDGANSEIGYGTYTLSGTTLTRTVTNSTNSNAAISLSGAAEVFITPRAQTLITTVKVQIFTSSGTYTPSANMVYAIVECQGPGGGGGGSTGNAGRLDASGGGSAGGYSRKLVSAADVGASKPVVVGTGGAGGVGGTGSNGSGPTTFGSTICVANAGNAGTYGAAGHPPTGGAGATAGTGDIAVGGQNGNPGISIASTSFTGAPSGSGGNSFFGGAGAGQSGGTVANGINATGYGSGGGGAVTNATTGTLTGGNGADGCCIITEFCSG